MSGPCIWCGAPLPTPSRKSRRYCSGACRVAAMRHRRTVEALVPMQPVGVVGAGALPRPADLDDQVAVAILEARSIAGAFLRLGREARPKLACRCEGVGQAVDEALRRFFPELKDQPYAGKQNTDAANLCSSQNPEETDSTT